MNLRTVRLAPIAIASLAILAACGEDEVAEPIPPAAQPATTTLPAAQPGELLPFSAEMYAAGAPLVAEFLGLPIVDFEAAVTGLGYGPVRVAALDGESLDVTADLVDGRVDVAVVTRDGTQVVVDAAVEIDPSGAPADEPVPVVAVYDEVSFYPACGNEELVHDGVHWYQVQESDFPVEYAAIFDVARAEPAEPAGFRSAARVVAPGPGDDVGTLVVWADGVARFVSDSGDLTAWLIDDELTYQWVC